MARLGGVCKLIDSDSPRFHRQFTPHFIERRVVDDSLTNAPYFEQLVAFGIFERAPFPTRTRRALSQFSHGQRTGETIGQATPRPSARHEAMRMRHGTCRREPVASHKSVSFVPHGSPPGFLPKPRQAAFGNRLKQP